MSSKMTSKLQQYQEDFYDEVFDFFGKDIIGSDTHPLKAAFNLYVEMKKDQETDDEEEEASKLCWTCDEAEATHKVFRDALGEYEHTCDKCFKKEYLEDVEEKDMLIYYKCKSCDFATDFTDPECSKCKKEMERIVEDSGNYSGNCLRCCECEKVFLGEDYLHWEEFEYICKPCVKKEGLEDEPDVCQECYSREHCNCEDDDEEEEEKDDEAVYTYYKCEHCGFATGKDDTDCSKCKKEMCMLCIQNCEDKVEEGKCEDCGNECVDLDDRLCHKCYHASVPPGECWCEFAISH